MKHFLRRIILVLIFGWSASGFAQKVVNQPLDAPSPGKALVYVLRTGAGPLLNFRIYDKDVFLGALNGGKYLVYECEPGEHLFWATSENRDFVDANLEADKVYVLDAQGQMGAFIASVALRPLNPTEFSDQKLLYQMVKNGKKQVYSKQNDDKAENIAKGLARYDELKTKNSSKIKTLSADMNFINADKPVKK